MQQAYREFSGPFFLGPASNITELRGNGYSAPVDSGTTIVENGIIQSPEDEWSQLRSATPIQIAPNRLLVSVVSVRSGVDGFKAVLKVDSQTIIAVRADDRMIVRTPRTEGQLSILNIGSIPGRDGFFVVAFAVQDGLVTAWINNQEVASQNVSDVITVEGTLFMPLAAIEQKFLGIWNGDNVPADISACIRDVMANYAIT